MNGTVMRFFHREPLEISVVEIARPVEREGGPAARMLSRSDEGGGRSHCAEPEPPGSTATAHDAGQRVRN